MKDYLRKLAGGEPLSEEETCAVFERLMAGAEEPATEAQIGSYLMATGAREITAEELIGGARALRKYMVPVDICQDIPGVQLLDTCGTGGSGLNTFNTSTINALICAAAGQHVAKHGNRGATSKCGSVDLLEALGIKFDLAREKIAQCCVETRFCFMFAPKHHPATARVGKIRRELGFRTIFNFLGPLANPAGAQCQLLGVSERKMVPTIAEALRALGLTRAMVVCGEDGLDELTLTAATLVNEIHGPEIREYLVTPEDFGLKRVPFPAIEGGSAEESAGRVRALLSSKASPYRDLVLLNAGAALYICGKADSIVRGIELARDCLDSGKAEEVLSRVIDVTNRDA